MTDDSMEHVAANVRAVAEILNKLNLSANIRAGTLMLARLGFVIPHDGDLAASPATEQAIGVMKEAIEFLRFSRDLGIRDCRRS